MEEHASTNTLKQELLSHFTFDSEKNLYVHPDNCTINYQDGGETYILDSMKKIHDLSSHSPEFAHYIRDWPSRYHFSQKRSNFLEGLKEIFPADADVLEIGSGCGTITRWLGEQFRSVDALEGSPQRAAITRYRTKDLENVKVYCGNLLTTGFDKKYDIITLIGSLEYIPFYDTEHAAPKDACAAILTRLRDALKDNGILLIAIENKFGAKYFSGCKEDHTDRAFEGLVGYPKKTPVTFSHNELEAMLTRSGFGNHQFYHVFPDYKLTETLIPENPEALTLYPYNWIRMPFEDYSGDRFNFFPDALFLKSITDAGLLWQFSNSFVIFASRSKNINLSVPWLIKKYSNHDNLKVKYWREITLIKDCTTPSDHQGKKYCVNKSPLFGVTSAEDNPHYEYRLNSNPYTPGSSLTFDIYTALLEDVPEIKFKQLIRKLHDHLLKDYATGETDSDGYPLVKGESIDYTFWNLIEDPDKGLVFVDQKWKVKEPITADQVIFRNLFWIFENICPFLKNKDKISFILSMLQDLYPQYSEKRLMNNLQFENLFQRFVTEPCPNLTTACSPHYSFSDQMILSRQMSEYIPVLEKTIAEKECRIKEITETMTREAEEKECRIKEITETMTREAEEKECRIKEIHAHEAYLMQKISAIESSIVWQLTMKFHTNVVERLLPQNTRRRKYYDLARTGGQALIHGGIFHKKDKLTGYQKWIKTNEPSPDILTQLNKTSCNFSYRPKISILVLVGDSDEILLHRAVESVICQIYDNWELCLVDGSSLKPDIKRTLNKYTQKDLRIKVKFLAENKGIAENLNVALSLAIGDYVGFLDPSDELTPFALYDVVFLLNQKQNFDFIYSDEDTIDRNQNRISPWFKPDWSPDLFLSQNYLSHFSVIRKALIDSIGGFRTGYEGAEDYDIFLRGTEKIPSEAIGHIPKILYHTRTRSYTNADLKEGKTPGISSAKKALKDALLRRDLQGEVKVGEFPGTYRICYTIHGNPRISIIIPTKDHVEILKRCVQSILNKTTYQNYEIVIVDNQSTMQETQDYYKSLKKNPQIKVLYYDKPFNFSAINNYAVAQVNSPYILFLNNDTEVISEEWLSAMLEHAQREGVGAVGAKLLYPNKLIQHAGVILGITGTPGQKGVAEHSHKFLPHNCRDYFFRAQIIGNYSAVTAACMMMRKDLFFEIGGFNEDFIIAFNDLDLCLKLMRAGYLIIYTPYSVLYHHESLSRGYDTTPEKQARFSQEVTNIRKHWGSVIDKGDPYYNPNLTLEKQDFSLKI
ncbi:MAG: glycosyltransferase [Methanoregula sp.]|nr:glycosyltransferase [Methanoregula sp.]